MTNSTRNILMLLIFALALAACAASQPVNTSAPAQTTVLQQNTDIGVLQPRYTINNTGGDTLYGVYMFRDEYGRACTVVANIYSGGINNAHDTASIDCGN